MPKRIAYISNLMSETVSVIDLDARSLLQNVEVGEYPVFSLVYPHDREKLLVTLHNYRKKEGEGRLLLVDPWDSQVVRNISYEGASMPSGMVYDKKRDVFYVADESLNQVYSHDGKTLELIDSLPAGEAPVHLDISGNGRYLVITNRMSKDLSVYHLEKGQAKVRDTLTTIQLGRTTGDPCHPYDVKFSPNSGICYVTDLDNGELLIVDIRKRGVTNRLRLGEGSFGIALEKAGKRAYVCNMGSGAVSVVDAGKKEKTADLTGFGSPTHCAIDEKGQQLVVTDQGRGTGKSPGIHIIDLTTGKITETIVDPLIKAPIGVTIGE